MSALPARSARHGGDAVLAEAPAALARYRTFHTLDALRGVAALVVLMFHAAFFYGLPTPAEGYLAVDLFFVMSGFIIAYRYGEDLARGMGTLRFLKVRLVRLYPLFLLGAVLGALPAVVALASGHADAAHRGLAASLPFAVLMLPSRLAMPHLLEVYPLNYVSWSLALELLVNLAYAATFSVWSTRRLAWLVTASIPGLCAVAWLHGSLNAGFDWSNAIGGVPRILFGFATGLLIHRLYASRRLRVGVPWWVLVALVPLLFYADPGASALAWLRPVYDMVVVVLIVPAIVVAAIGSEPPSAARGACALAGVFSYVLYSLHAPFVGLFLRGEQELHLDLTVTTPAKAIAFTLLLVALCVSAHVGYDKPVRRRLMRIGRSGPARVAGDAILPSRG